MSHFRPAKDFHLQQNKERAPIGRMCSLSQGYADLSLIDKSARLGVHFVAEAIDCCDLRVLSC